jgi:hypothetical protein
MLYHDNDAVRLLTREHTERLAHEMRRVRRLTPAEAGYPGWGRLAAGLLGRADRLRVSKARRTPAYEG